ncbi:unnamed protein product [Amoebophrya sp. A25]|nr:unnamed protein product [Amoebophrya sp. A25]|eukprot:GSA25T00012135001.1
MAAPKSNLWPLLRLGQRSVFICLLLGVSRVSSEAFVHLIAPADVRKDGGLKFRANLPIPERLVELKESFRLAHLERYGSPGYVDFEFFNTRLEQTVDSVDQLEDGDELRLFRKRGTTSLSRGAQHPDSEVVAGDVAGQHQQAQEQEQSKAPSRSEDAAGKERDRFHGRSAEEIIGGPTQGKAENYADGVAASPPNVAAGEDVKKKTGPAGVNDGTTGTSSPQQQQSETSTPRRTRNRGLDALTSAPMDSEAQNDAPSASLPDPSSPFYLSELLYTLTSAANVPTKLRRQVLHKVNEAPLSDFQRRQILDDYPVSLEDCREVDKEEAVGTAVAASSSSSDSSVGRTSPENPHHQDEGIDASSPSMSFRAFAERFVHLHPTARGILRLAECQPAFREGLVRSHFERKWTHQLKPLFEKAARGLTSTTGDSGTQLSTAYFTGYIGQEEALKMIRPLVQEQVLGRRISDSPLSFLFLGPSGVGKTELARKVAEKIHCGDQQSSDGDHQALTAGAASSSCNIKSLTKAGKFVEFKMGNYRNEEQFTSWIGVPDGVKGSDGKLSEILFSNPDAVIYLDEIEKAIPTAGDLLLAMLDNKGSVQVSKTGQHISTVKATFILSSNLATNEILSVWASTTGSYYSSTPLTPREKYEKILGKLDYALSQSKMFARPEVRNRIAAIVPFTPFLDSEIRQVIDLELKKLRRSYKKSEGWGHPNIVWTQRVVDFLADPLRNVHFENALSKGNLRELIRFLEQTVNRALNLAKDCENAVCEVFSSTLTVAGGTTSPTSTAIVAAGTTSICRPKASDVISGATDNFLLDVRDETGGSGGLPHIVADSVPTSLREALLFCNLPDTASGGLSGVLLGTSTPGKALTDLQNLAADTLGGVFGGLLNSGSDASSGSGTLSGSVVRGGQQKHQGPATGSSATSRRTTGLQPQGPEVGTDGTRTSRSSGGVSPSSFTPAATGSSAPGASSESGGSLFESDFEYDCVWQFVFSYQRTWSSLIAWSFFLLVGFWSAALAFVLLNYGILPLAEVLYSAWRALPPGVQQVIIAGGEAAAQIGKKAVEHFDYTFMVLLFFEYQFGLLRFVGRHLLSLLCWFGQRIKKRLGEVQKVYGRGDFGATISSSSSLPKSGSIELPLVLGKEGTFKSTPPATISSTFPADDNEASKRRKLYARAVAAAVIRRLKEDGCVSLEKKKDEPTLGATTASSGAPTVTSQADICETYLATAILRILQVNAQMMKSDSSGMVPQDSHPSLGRKKGGNQSSDAPDSSMYRHPHLLADSLQIGGDAVFPDQRSAGFTQMDVRFLKGFATSMLQQLSTENLSSIADTTFGALDREQQNMGDHNSTTQDVVDAPDEVTTNGSGKMKGAGAAPTPSALSLRSDGKKVEMTKTTNHAFGPNKAVGKSKPGAVGNIAQGHRLSGGDSGKSSPHEDNDDTDDELAS